MEKPANTELELHPLLIKRYSPRAFSAEPIKPEKLDRILEAGRWAPSASNDQPWRFIVGIKGQNEYYDKLFQGLVDFNQKWCKNVPVLIAFVANKISDKNKDLNAYYKYDLGQAAAHITFQAMEEGLWCHQMGGFEKDRLSKEFNLPEKFELLSIMAVGYKGALDSLPENFQRMEQSERTRKPLSDLVFDGDWK